MTFTDRERDVLLAALHQYADQLIPWNLSVTGRLEQGARQRLARDLYWTLACEYAR